MRVPVQISWDIVKGIVVDDLQRRFAKPKLRSLKRIAIDEIYLGKRHKYLTIVMDLTRSREPQRRGTTNSWTCRLL
ncbi:MAG: hypothetical protein AABP62_31505, partial [Planctomycetota bacterium]